MYLVITLIIVPSQCHVDTSMSGFIKGYTVGKSGADKNLIICFDKNVLKWHEEGDRCILYFDIKKCLKTTSQKYQNLQEILQKVPRLNNILQMLNSV